MAAPTGGGALPPISWDIVEEHLDEAAFLHSQWERALSDPEYVLEDVGAGPERRMLAHLDGLVVAGRRAAQKALAPAIEGDDLDRVFAAAWALLASEDGDFTALVLAALAKAEPAPAAAIGRALEVAPRDDLLPRLAPVLAGGKASPAAVAVVLRVLAHRRLDCGVRLDPFQGSPDVGVRAAALKLARVFPKSAHPALLERALASRDPTERDEALATCLVVGVRPVWPACLKALADGGERWAFPALLYGLSGEADLAPLTAALGDPARRRAALFALGFTGRVAAAEAVLPWLGDKKDGAVAGEAFSAITGLALTGKLAKPPKRWNPEAPEEEEEDVGPEADLPIPDPEQVAGWWSRKKLDPGKRLLGGQPWSGNGLLDALEHGPMRRREALALDLAVRTRGVHQIEVRAMAHRQREELAAAPGRPPPATAYQRLLAAPTPAAQHRPARVAGARPMDAPGGGRAALAVTGIGLATSLGRSLRTVAAAIRAGISRPGPLAEVPVFDEEAGEGGAATVHAVPAAYGFSGAGRLVVLCREALASLREQGAPRPGRTALLVAVASGEVLAAAEALAIARANAPARGDEPESEPPPDDEPADYVLPPPGSGTRELHAAACAKHLLPWLREATAADGPLVDARLLPGDAPAFVTALAEAQRVLASGVADRCLIGAVDSLVDRRRIEALQGAGLLHGAGNPTGTVPGEAAAFLVVEPPAAVARARAAVHLEIESFASDREPAGHFGDHPAIGTALARAIRAALTPVPGDGRPVLVVTDLDGDTARSRDWGHALVKHPVLGSDVAEWWTPAAALGDVGAAAGPIALALAAHGFARGHAPGPRALVWLWGEAGDRGAVVVRAPARPRQPA